MNANKGNNSNNIEKNQILNNSDSNNENEQIANYKISECDLKCEEKISRVQKILYPQWKEQLIFIIN